MSRTSLPPLVESEPFTHPRCSQFRTKKFAPRVLLLTALAIVSLSFVPPAAKAEPSDRTLVYVGLALTPPTYFLGVGLHEGSHALAAKLIGAKVLSISILPGRAKNGAFHFGITSVRGLRGRAERTFFYTAPKITDALLLSGFAGLALTDGWPSNRYAQLGLVVFATGLWVDFSKDVLSFSKHNDVIKTMNLYCLNSELRRLPVRLLYAAAAVGFGYVVYRGYDRLFGSSDTDAVARSADGNMWSLPLWQRSF